MCAIARLSYDERGLDGADRLDEFFHRILVVALPESRAENVRYPGARRRSPVKIGAVFEMQTFEIGKMVALGETANAALMRALSRQRQLARLQHQRGSFL